LPLVTKADGGLIPPDNYYIWETQQRGAIFYESESQMETLVLSMTFQGNAKDFAWIIPTPNQPEVTQGTQDLFVELEDLTGGYYYPAYDYSVGLGAESTEKDSGVTVLEQKTVDYYDISVLSATDSTALSKWLTDNGYKYPEKYKYIFTDYINNGWYFVAAKIVPEMAEDTDVASELSTGTATPLALTFTAENITFPLKISQISADTQNVPVTSSDYYSSYYTSPYMSIYLYVITDHKQELSGFTTEYADTIKSKEVKKLATNSNGDYWVDPQQNKYWLTKLYHSSYYVADMKKDLFPKDADKDTKVKSGYEWDGEDTAKMIFYTVIMAVFGLLGALFTPFFLFFLIFSLVYYLTSRPAVRTVMKVFQIIDVVVSGLLVVASIIFSVYAMVKLFNGSSYYYAMDDEMALASAGLACIIMYGLLFAGKIIALVIQKRKAKKNK